MLVWDFCYPHAFLFFSFLSLYLKNWSHLHSLAWTDGVIRNKILNSILKRIISAPIPCKQLSSRQQGKASKTPHPLRGLSKVESITWALGVGTCTGQGWETPAEKRASSRICSGIFSWEFGSSSPASGIAAGCSLAQGQEMLRALLWGGIRAPQIAARHWEQMRVAVLSPTPTGM